jgi:transposase
LGAAGARQPQRGQDRRTREERVELARLRKENGELKRERELLKKWAAFFAKENA